jgi:predicted alpha/beta superfamily hydrolase
VVRPAVLLLVASLAWLAPGAGGATASAQRGGSGSQRPKGRGAKGKPGPKVVGSKAVGSSTTKPTAPKKKLGQIAADRRNKERPATLPLLRTAHRVVPRGGAGVLEPDVIDGREVTIYLPPGYGESDRHYKVVYMQDGQALFGGGWELHQILDAEIANGLVEPVIVVGIRDAGSHLKRVGEYAPTFDAAEGAGGGADAYLSFVKDVIKPSIDRRYLTKRSAKDTALAGSSMGGLVALHGGLTRPETFGNVIALSPSAWWNGGEMARRVRGMTTVPDVSIYLDSGGSGYLNDKKDDVFALRDALADRGRTFDKTLWHWYEAGHAHDVAAWKERVGPAFRRIFPAKRP